MNHNLMICPGEIPGKENRRKAQEKNRRTEEKEIESRFVPGVQIDVLNVIDEVLDVLKLSFHFDLSVFGLLLTTGVAMSSAGKWKVLQWLFAIIVRLASFCEKREDGD